MLLLNQGSTCPGPYPTFIELFTVLLPLNGDLPCVDAGEAETEGVDGDPAPILTSLFVGVVVPEAVDASAASAASAGLNTLLKTCSKSSC